MSTTVPNVVPRYTHAPGKPQHDFYYYSTSTSNSSSQPQQQLQPASPTPYTHIPYQQPSPPVCNCVQCHYSNLPPAPADQLLLVVAGDHHTHHDARTAAAACAHHDPLLLLHHKSQPVQAHHAHAPQAPLPGLLHNHFLSNSHANNDSLPLSLSHFSTSTSTAPSPPLLELSHHHYPPPPPPLPYLDVNSTNTHNNNNNYMATTVQLAAASSVGLMNSTSSSSFINNNKEDSTMMDSRLRPLPQPQPQSTTLPHYQQQPQHNNTSNIVSAPSSAELSSILNLTNPTSSAATSTSSTTTNSVVASNEYGVYTPTQTPRRTRRRRKRSPDWSEFYKNGYPSEVIVISSSDEDDNNDLDEQDNALFSTSSSNKRTQDQLLLLPRVIEPSTKRRRRLTTTTTTNNNIHDDLPKAPIWQPPRKPIQKPGEIVVRKIPDFERRKPSSYDDDEGFYHIECNSDFTQRYRISKLLGQGTFGKVVSAFDKVRGTQCAIKIIRAVPKYREASKIELRVLTTLSKYDQDNVNKCIHLRECFDYRNHICIVTDLLGMSVYDFMKANDFMGFPGSHVQNFALQLFRSVNFLHGLGLIHTDLKPENILLVDSTFTIAPNGATSSSSSSSPKKKYMNVLNNTNIHVIDFGSAVFEDEYHSQVVSTRHYRAPEIILDTGWSYACDIWSIGCILCELVIGEALFQTHDNAEHLAIMEKLFGKIDRNMIRRARMTTAGAQLFDSKYRLQYPTCSTTNDGKYYVDGLTTIDRLMKACNPNYNKNRKFWNQFLDLIKRIFVYDPALRISAREALEHPWFSTFIEDQGSGSIIAM